MNRSILISAALTGLFCSAFAIGVDILTSMLNRPSLVGVSFLSGFLGSLFASLVMRQAKKS